MFGQLIDLESWKVLVKRALIGFAVLALSPVAMLPLGLLAVLSVPVAVVGIPFLLPAFFGGAVTEHHAAVRDSMRPPMPAAHAVAH